MTFSVTITDVSDEDPQCTPASYDQTINENVVVDTTVVTITCSDSDNAENIAYSIDPNTDTGGTFKIGAANGIVQIATGKYFLHLFPFLTFLLSNFSPGLWNNSILCIKH